MASPGEIIPAAAPPIRLNDGRPNQQLTVRNTGDRAIQVGSHYHFFEVNKALSFDRPAAFGMRLDIPAGTAIRFEPGAQQRVTLVGFAGTRRVIGFAGIVNGDVDAAGVREASLEHAKSSGFIIAGQEGDSD